MAQVKMTARRAKFIEHYFGDALFNASESARLAGFKQHQVAGPRLVKMLGELIRVKQDEWEAKMEMNGQEIRRKLTSIAQNDMHKDQVRALELLAKITGQLSDKVQVNVERSQLEQQLVVALEALKAN